MRADGGKGLLATRRSQGMGAGRRAISAGGDGGGWLLSLGQGAEVVVKVVDGVDLETDFREALHGVSWNKEGRGESAP